MNHTIDATEDVEAIRQQYVDELKADGEDAYDGSAPGTYGCHELLDRTSMMMKNVEEFVLSHPSCLINKEWFALAHKAVEALNDLYQKIGAEHLEKTPET
jgi:hypothetical protein